MAFHVERGDGVIFETECAKRAQSIRTNVAGELSIVDGSIDFLRGRAVRKFAQKRRDYASDIA